jgi:C4-dicarboxylate-specific signal transduction histidine kinase
MKRAFVLRLTQESQPVGGKFEGCVEEVDSGKSQRFASVEEFLSFLQSCLGDHKYEDLVQFLGSSTDITDHKCAEQQHEKLRQLEAELAHINRVSMLGEMAASLAHEIKQPIAAAITSANSCIEWLAHEPPNIERAIATATRIDRYGKRAAEIIDRIRSFYRKSPPQPRRSPRVTHLCSVRVTHTKNRVATEGLLVSS